MGRQSGRAAACLIALPLCRTPVLELTRRRDLCDLSSLDAIRAQTPGLRTLTSVPGNTSLAYDPQLRLTQVAAGTSIVSASYESPEVGGGGSAINPTVSGMTFSGNSGIMGYGSIWGIGFPPDGDQFAFMQGGGSFSHTLSGLSSGTTYTLKFWIAGRQTAGGLPTTVSVNGTSLGTFTAAGTAFEEISLSFTASGSSATITFAGATTATDSATAIDHVRVTPTSASGTTKFAYDGTNMIAEYDAANALQRRYVFGPGVDAPIVQYDSAGNRTFLSSDERGSVIALTDSSGAVIAKNSYDEYGIPGSSNQGRFQYTGQMWLSELGMYHYKARLYSPTLGRFLQTDPAGGTNLYAYVGNNPTNATDPSGMIEKSARISPTLESIMNEMFPPPGKIHHSYVSIPGNVTHVGGRLDEIILDNAAAALTKLNALSATTGIDLQCLLSCSYGTINALMNPLSAAAGGMFQNASFNLLGDHDYAISNVICPSSWGCTAGLVGSIYSLVVNQLPGNNSNSKIISGNTYTVYAPGTGIAVGNVKTYLGAGGLTVNNFTVWPHIFYGGWVNRNAIESSGTWYSYTHGTGTNYIGGVFGAMWNDALGQNSFSSLDASIRAQLYAATH